MTRSSDRPDRFRFTTAIVAAALCLATVPIGTVSADGPTSDWLNQDWSDDSEVGCTLDRDEDGQWYEDGHWWRVEAPEEGQGERDARLISPVIQTGGDALEITFDFDYLNSWLNADFGQMIIVHEIGTITTCTYEDDCENVDPAGGDDRIWCVLSNDYAWGKTITVPADELSDEVRLMVRYYNDAFEEHGDGYLKVGGIDVETVCDAPTTTLVTGEPSHDEYYVANDTELSLDVDQSGVETEYRINSSDWQPYEGPFTLSGDDGPREIEYRSGKDGCWEDIQSAERFLDDTPPEVEIVEPQAEGNEEAETVRGALGEALGQLEGVCRLVLAPGMCENVTGLAEGDALDPAFERVHPLVQEAREEAAQTCQGTLSELLCGTLDTALGLLAETTAPGQEPTDEDAAVVSGETTVRAEADDPIRGGDASGVSHVEFYVDGEHRHTDSTDPYEWTWDTTEDGAGTYELEAVAEDNVAHQASDSRTVVVVPS